MSEGKKISQRTLKRNGWRESGVYGNDVQMSRGSKYRFYNYGSGMSTIIFDRVKGFPFIRCIGVKKKRKKK